MGVEAAELIVCPPGKGVVDSGVDPQQNLLTISHGLGVEGAGVDD